MIVTCLQAHFLNFAWICSFVLQSNFESTVSLQPFPQVSMPDDIVDDIGGAGRGGVHHCLRNMNGNNVRYIIMGVHAQNALFTCIFSNPCSLFLKQFIDTIQNYSTIWKEEMQHYQAILNKK